MPKSNYTCYDNHNAEQRLLQKYYMNYVIGFFLHHINPVKVKFSLFWRYEEVIYWCIMNVSPVLINK